MTIFYFVLYVYSMVEFFQGLDGGDLVFSVAALAASYLFFTFFMRLIYKYQLPHY